jgi:hypothetical protein
LQNVVFGAGRVSDATTSAPQVDGEVVVPLGSGLQPDECPTAFLDVAIGFANATGCVEDGRTGSSGSVVFMIVSMSIEANPGRGRIVKKEKGLRGNRRSPFK